MSFLLDEEKTWIQRDFGLDRRLIKAISKLGFTYPTLVQSKSIPIALQGKDILVRARTGSGNRVYRGSLKLSSQCCISFHPMLTHHHYHCRENCGIFSSPITQASYY